MLRLFDTAVTFRRGVVEKVSFIFLVYLDLALTIFAVSYGLSELNPYMQSLLASPVNLLLTKCLAALVIAWIVPSRLLLPAIGFLVLVTGWNLHQLAIFFG